jgi:hypothetical protein
VTIRDVQQGEDLTVAYDKSWSDYDSDQPCGCSVCDPDRVVTPHRKHPLKSQTATLASHKRQREEVPEASSSTPAPYQGKKIRRSGRNHDRGRFSSKGSKKLVTTP